jgi:hypothetical protein
MFIFDGLISFPRIELISHSIPTSIESSIKTIPNILSIFYSTDNLFLPD